MGLPAIERKNVLDLFPYFSKQPIIVDVGSNKGEWTSLLAANVNEAHLFEPNIIMLHYSMVSLCDHKNISYHPYAISDTYKKVSLQTFTDSHNGLSNIFGNKKWLDIPHKAQEVLSVPLDGQLMGISHIDFLKIDVEGAEMLVLKGCKVLLMQKKIKFIQVEKAEHIELSGYTFQQLEDYLKSFGYAPIPTDDTENVIFAMEGFTQDWNTMFKLNTQGLTTDFALEIGCFEGLTSRYICDNILLPGGRLICVDPLTDQYLDNHADNHIFVGQYGRFIRNTKGYPIELIRKKSEDAFDQLKDYRFGLIYVDGDHREEAVFNDGVHAFRMCKENGGHILFDDYIGYSEETTRGIQRFLETQAGNFEVVKSNYQLLIKRIR